MSTVKKYKLLKDDELIGEIEAPYSPKYQRLFAKVLLCQTGFTKQDLDDIVSIVFSDFKENDINY